jgi:hypothetical protein
MKSALIALITGAPHGLNISNSDEFNEALLRLLPE